MRNESLHVVKAQGMLYTYYSSTSGADGTLPSLDMSRRHSKIRLLCSDQPHDARLDPSGEHDRFANVTDLQTAKKRSF